MRQWLQKLNKQSIKTLPSEQAYTQWAEQYPAQAHNAFMQCETAAMQTLMPNLQDKIILDLACGTGRWGQYAQQKGAALVIGVDSSPDMLALGVLRNRVQAFMDHVPVVDQSIHVILCGLAVGHLPQSRFQKTFAEIKRVLHPQGMVLVSDLHPFQAWSGAKRTFTGADGNTYAVEHYPYSYADYQRVAVQNHFVIDGVVEQKLLTDRPPVVLALRLKQL